MLRLATEPVVCATLEEIARAGARRALQKAIEDEVADYINTHRDQLDQAGHRLVVRNGHKPARTILSGVGPIEVKPPRVMSQRCAASPGSVASAPRAHVVEHLGPGKSSLQRMPEPEIVESIEEPPVPANREANERTTNLKPETVDAGD
jgi:hypothetical protein